MGHMTGVLLINIEAAFRSVPQCSLVNCMMVRKMGKELIGWTGSFLSETAVEMIMEGTAIERQPLIKGSHKAHMCHPFSWRY